LNPTYPFRHLSHKPTFLLSFSPFAFPSPSLSFSPIFPSFLSFSNLVTSCKTSDNRKVRYSRLQTLEKWEKDTIDNIGNMCSFSISLFCNIIFSYIFLLFNVLLFFTFHFDTFLCYFWKLLYYSFHGFDILSLDQE